MQISVETIGALGRRMTVAVPAERLEQTFSERLQRLSRQVKVPGFRPGKVPLKMIEARYGEQLIEEAASDIIQSTLSEAIGAQGLKPAGGTRIRHKSLARGQSFEYIAEFDIYPEITQLDLSNKEIEVPKPTITEEDVERTLSSIRQQHVTWKPVERAAQTDDRLRIDFVGRLNGTEFEGGKAQNFSVILGSNTFVGDLEQRLIGAMPGETRSIPVAFPKDYREAKLAGQEVEFEVHINDVAEPVLPEFDETLVKQLGVADGNLVTLRNEIRLNLDREADNRARAVTRNRVFQALLEANRFELPESLIEAEMERMKRAIETEQRGRAPVTIDDGVYRDRARTRVALGLVLAEIIRVRELRADTAKVRERITQMATDYEAPNKFIEWYYADPKRLGEIEAMVLEEQAVELLLETAQVRDQPMNFQDLLKLKTA